MVETLHLKAWQSTPKFYPFGMTPLECLYGTSFPFVHIRSCAKAKIVSWQLITVHVSLEE